MRKLKIPEWNGDALRELRKDRGLTQVGLTKQFNKVGALIGEATHDTSVSAWERGHEPSKRAHLLILCHVLKCGLDDLFAS